MVPTGNNKSQKNSKYLRPEVSPDRAGGGIPHRKDKGFHVSKGVQTPCKAREGGIPENLFGKYGEAGDPHP